MSDQTGGINPQLDKIKQAGELLADVDASCTELVRGVIDTGELTELSMGIVQLYSVVCMTRQTLETLEELRVLS